MSGRVRPLYEGLITSEEVIYRNRKSWNSSWICSRRSLRNVSLSTLWSKSSSILFVRLWKRAVVVSPAHTACHADPTLVNELARDGTHAAGPPLKKQRTELFAGPRDTDHPDLCHARPGDKVILIHGSIHEVVFNGYGTYDGMVHVLALHENSNDCAHGNFVTIFADSPSASQSRSFGKLLSMVVGSWKPTCCQQFPSYILTGWSWGSVTSTSPFSSTTCCCAATAATGWVDSFDEHWNCSFIVKDHVSEHRSTCTEKICEFPDGIIITVVPGVSIEEVSSLWFTTCDVDNRKDLYVCFLGHRRACVGVIQWIALMWYSFPWSVYLFESLWRQTLQWWD